VVVGVVEVLGEDFDGGIEEHAEAVGGFAPEFFVAAMEFGLEEGVGPPVEEGAAVDAEDAGDDFIALADGEELDGAALVWGEPRG
jgi:hypothetical protein